MLDMDPGRYPYVPSSKTVAGAVAPGAGSGPGSVGYVLGITKAYTPRVGSGPFPSETLNDIGRLLGERGREFGVVTGRARRCGWLDAVLVRQAVKVGGIDGLALTKLDVLDGLPEIQVCVGYEHQGRRLDHLPASQRVQAELTPVYEPMEGWTDSTRGARSWAEPTATAVHNVRPVAARARAQVARLVPTPRPRRPLLGTAPAES